MGQFSITLEIANTGDPSRRDETTLLVDTGATLSWVPAAAIAKIGARRLTRREFLLADGRSIERDTAGVMMRYNGVEAIVTVVVAEEGDAHLLGATALETLGFAVDPVNLRLIPQALLAM